MGTRFERSREGHILGGVCAALADRFTIDRNLVRLAFALLAFASGLGIVAYLILWMTLPGTNSGAGSSWSRLLANAQEIGPISTGLMQSASEAWHRSEKDSWPRPLSRRWIGIALVTAGAWLALGSLGLFSWIGVGTAFGLGAIILGVALIVSTPESRSRRSR